MLLTIERFGAADRRDGRAACRRPNATGVLTTDRDGRPRRPACDAVLRGGRRPLAASGLRRSDPTAALYERFGDEPTPFYLFGAGHVGRALAVALAPLPFAVTWIDTRPGRDPGRRFR